MKSILVSSGYGGNTKEPFVMVETDALDRPLQFSPEEARELGMSLVQAAEAADTDAFLVEFFRGEMKQPNDHVFALLMEFRKHRKKRRKL